MRPHHDQVGVVVAGGVDDRLVWHASSEVPFGVDADRLAGVGNRVERPLTGSFRFLDAHVPVTHRGVGLVDDEQRVGGRVVPLRDVESVVGRFLARLAPVRRDQDPLMPIYVEC